LIVDQPTFEKFFKVINARDFKQNGVSSQMKTYPSEIFIPNIEVLNHDFYEVIKPSISAFEEYLKFEYGNECEFVSVVLDRKRILLQIRVYEADLNSLGTDERVEFWTMTDWQRNGYFLVTC
jgi:hypothetical protein